MSPERSGLELPALRQERKGWSLSQDYPDVLGISHPGREAPILVKQSFRLVKGKHQQAGENLRPDRVKLKHKICHDAEVAAAAAYSPKQVLVVIRARLNQLACRCDHVCRDQVVDRQTKLAGQPAKAATQRQAGSAGCRVDSQGNCQTKGLSFMINIAQSRARLTYALRACGST